MSESQRLADAERTWRYENTGDTDDEGEQLSSALGSVSVTATTSAATAQRCVSERQPPPPPREDAVSREEGGERKQDNIRKEMKRLKSRQKKLRRMLEEKEEDSTSDEKAKRPSANSLKGQVEAQSRRGDEQQGPNQNLHVDTDTEDIHVGDTGPAQNAACQQTRSPTFNADILHHTEGREQPKSQQHVKSSSNHEKVLQAHSKSKRKTQSASSPATMELLVKANTLDTQTCETIMRHLYGRYCLYGNRDNDTPVSSEQDAASAVFQGLTLINNLQFSKLCGDTKMVDDDSLTQADLDIVYRTVMARMAKMRDGPANVHQWKESIFGVRSVRRSMLSLRLDFERFSQGLALLAVKKYCSKECQRTIEEFVGGPWNAFSLLGKAESPQEASASLFYAFTGCRSTQEPGLRSFAPTHMQRNRFVATSTLVERHSITPRSALRLLLYGFLLPLAIRHGVIESLSDAIESGPQSLGVMPPYEADEIYEGAYADENGEDVVHNEAETYSNPRKTGTSVAPVTQQSAAAPEKSRQRQTSKPVAAKTGYANRFEAQKIVQQKEKGHKANLQNGVANEEEMDNPPWRSSAYHSAQRSRASTPDSDANGARTGGSASHSIQNGHSDVLSHAAYDAHSDVSITNVKPADRRTENGGQGAFSHHSFNPPVSRKIGSRQRGKADTDYAMARVFRDFNPERHIGKGTREIPNNNARELLEYFQGYEYSRMIFEESPQQADAMQQMGSPDTSAKEGLASLHHQSPIGLSNGYYVADNVHSSYPTPAERSAPPTDVAQKEWQRQFAMSSTEKRDMEQKLDNMVDAHYNRHQTVVNEEAPSPVPMPVLDGDRTFNESYGEEHNTDHVTGEYGIREEAADSNNMTLETYTENHEALTPGLLASTPFSQRSGNQRTPSSGDKGKTRVVTFEQNASPSRVALGDTYGYEQNGEAPKSHSNNPKEVRDAAVSPVPSSARSTSNHSAPGTQTATTVWSIPYYMSPSADHQGLFAAPFLVPVTCASTNGGGVLWQSSARQQPPYSASPYNRRPLLRNRAPTTVSTSAQRRYETPDPYYVGASRMTHPATAPDSHPKNNVVMENGGTRFEFSGMNNALADQTDHRIETPRGAALSVHMVNSNARKLQPRKPQIQRKLCE
eukprot:gb/GECG01013341.1/.p1 GENE.gb/GECG01013341.1/~~gb/GECG01013341.1/.p1  ORF type:complete len:1136 (+),score=158.51 gb/GECG01013341.1/:1-3408(+)